MLAQQRVIELASRRDVHAAFQWLHLQEQRLLGWQMEMMRIPAPPFKEQARAEWVCERFREFGLEQVEIDSEGNALGKLIGTGEGPFVLISAHLDTVFPEETAPEPRWEEGRLWGPSAADNTSGLTGLLAIAGALKSSAINLPCTILFAANVGEEAEGNLRGMRHLFFRSEYASRIGATICLEGAGTEPVVIGGIGSRRLEAVIEGPGGHSWTDANVPNPIFIMSRALEWLSRLELPKHPRTTLSVGRIEGGMAVTSIPERVSCLLDLRSIDPQELITLEVRVHRALEDAVMEINKEIAKDSRLKLKVRTIGDRPAGALSENSRLLETVRAVDRHLRLRTELRVGSTDVNIPLALGREAVAVGAGGVAGGIHTYGEWFEPAGRDLALRRVLLLVMDCCSWLSE